MPPFKLDAVYTPTADQPKAVDGLVEGVAECPFTPVDVPGARTTVAIREGDAAAEAQLQGELARFSRTEDAAIGIQSFLTRTTATFLGR